MGGTSSARADLVVVGAGLVSAPRAVLGVLLIASVAQAAAPFDLAERRSEWPAHDYLTVERALRFDVDEGGITYSFSREVAVLRDSARESLALFELRQTPGCAELESLRIEVTDRFGVTSVVTQDDFLSSARGDHPRDAERSRIDLRVPRRGVAAGSRLLEEFVMRYPIGCYGGTTAVKRTLGPFATPLLREVVEVACTGPCAAAITGPGPAPALAAVDGGYRLERSVLPPRQVEPARPAKSWRETRVHVGYPDGDPATVLGADLQRETARWRGVVAAHKKESNWGDHGGFEDPVRVAHALVHHLDDPAGSGLWSFGGDWGDPRDRKGRLLLPLEWWALASAYGTAVGGWPVLVQRNLSRVPAAGSWIAWGTPGVWIPGVGIATPSRLYGEEDGAIPELAGAWIAEMDGPPRQLQDVVGRKVMAAKATIDESGRLDVQGEATWSGGRGVRPRQYRDKVYAEWASRPPKRRRSTPQSRILKGAQSWMQRPLVRGQVDGDAPPGVYRVEYRYREDAGVDARGALRILTPPIPVANDLVTAGRESGERRGPYALASRDDELVLVIKPPTGMRVLGQPEDRAHDAHGVAVSVQWSPAGDGLKLTLTCRVQGPLLDASAADSVRTAAAILREVQRTRLVLAPKPN